MKKCYRCGFEKDENEFGRDKSRKDGLSNTCKRCHAEASRKYRETHIEKSRAASKRYWDEHKEQSKENHRKYYAANKSRLIEGVTKWRKENPDKVSQYASNTRSRRTDFVNSLKTPCKKCGEDRLWVIDFHHKDPSTKEFNIMQERTRKKEEIVLEVEKCICLCRNCHAEFHYFYGTNPTKPIEALSEYLEVN